MLIVFVQLFDDPAVLFVHDSSPFISCVRLVIMMKQIPATGSFAYGISVPLVYPILISVPTGLRHEPGRFRRMAIVPDIRLGSTLPASGHSLHPKAACTEHHPQISASRIRFCFPVHLSLCSGWILCTLTGRKNSCHHPGPDRLSICRKTVKHTHLHGLKRC